MTYNLSAMFLIVGLLSHSTGYVIDRSFELISSLQTMNVDNDLSPSDTSALNKFATYLATEFLRTQPQSAIQATCEHRHKVPDIEFDTIRGYFNRLC